MARKEIETSDDLKKSHRRALMANIRMAMVQKQEGGGEIERGFVEEDTDPFDPFYIPVGSILRPPFSFANLYQIYEEGDVLAECIDAMVQNIDGFGYQLLYLGEDEDVLNDKQAQKELLRGKNFFDRVNDEQSFTTIRKLMRADLEVIGNGSFEVVRNNYNLPAMMFHLPFRRLRMTKVDKVPTRVVVNIMRDGKMVSIPMKKYFRRFCQISAVTGLKLRWYKQFGDPRILDAKTGEYVNSRGEAKAVATEIIHYKIPFGDSPYGVPRWIQVLLDIKGRRSSQYVNWDLFENQGIPALAILVQGGVLTEESLEELEVMIRSMRGTEKFNRIMILEANPETQGLEDKGSVKIEIKPLAEYRKEDQMFTKYLDTSAESIRHRYRLPPLYVGWASTFTHATSKSAKEVAEEQIFVPERSSFDEGVDTRILPALEITKWKFTSKGPMIVGAEEISSGVTAFEQVGAFTVNHAISMANTAYGLQMSKFKEPWGDLPFGLIKALITGGMVLKGIKKFAEEPQAPPKPASAPPELAVIQGGKKPPIVPNKAIKKMRAKGELSKEEEALYFRLKEIQSQIEEEEVEAV